RGPDRGRPGHDHLRPMRESTLSGPAVAATGGGAGGELPADQRRTEGGGRATDAARPRLTPPASPKLHSTRSLLDIFQPGCSLGATGSAGRPLPLSAVAWQSGLMHSP